MLSPIPMTMRAIKSKKPMDNGDAESAYGSVKSGNAGLFVLFMRKYPNVNVHISTYKGGGITNGKGTLSFDNMVEL